MVSPKAGGPTQSQPSLPVSSGHHTSMAHRLLRKHPQLLDCVTNAINETFSKEKQEKSKKKHFLKKWNTFLKRNENMKAGLPSNGSFPIPCSSRLKNRIFTKENIHTRNFSTIFFFPVWASARGTENCKRETKKKKRNTRKDKGKRNAKQKIFFLKKKTKKFL